LQEYLNIIFGRIYRRYNFGFVISILSAAKDSDQDSIYWKIPTLQSMAFWRNYGGGGGGGKNEERNGEIKLKG
jgi:hypothetical protein